MSVAAGTQPEGLRAPLWRAIAAFRFASLAYAALLLVLDHANYWRLPWAWTVLAAMLAWTVISVRRYARPAGRTRSLLGADLVVSAAALLSTGLLQYGSATDRSIPVTATWVAGPVLAWAVAAGRRAGMTATGHGDRRLPDVAGRGGPRPRRGGVRGGSRPG
ncbi:MAG TPA: DUF5931 domain-containing protein [Streptosporangiaceae bacterium]|jgi:hypothetical protein